jgi:hypothetical protein
LNDFVRRAGQILKIEVLDHGAWQLFILKIAWLFSVALDNAEHTGRFFKTLWNRPYFLPPGNSA